MERPRKCGQIQGGLSCQGRSTTCRVDTGSSKERMGDVGPKQYPHSPQVEGGGHRLFFNYSIVILPHIS